MVMGLSMMMGSDYGNEGTVCGDKGMLLVTIVYTRGDKFVVCGDGAVSVVLEKCLR